MAACRLSPSLPQRRQVWHLTTRMGPPGSYPIAGTEDTPINLNQLLDRIAKWEDIHTEFAQEMIHPDDLAAALVSFANTDGGQLIFGVSNDRQIVGIGPDAGRLMQRIDPIAYQNCEPPLTVIQEHVTNADGSMVLVVNVPKGDQRPYRTSAGVYFIRTTSGRRRASRQELLRLFQAAESLYYDETTIQRASVADIDTRGFGDAIQRAYGRSPADFGLGLDGLLRNLNLVKQINGRQHPTVAGLLLFGKVPQDFLPHAMVVTARIPGVDPGAPPSDAKQIGGPLTDMLEDTARFLRIHLQVRHRIEGFQPETFPELPEEALREVLVNAFCHRDYTVAAPIRVFVYDDRVEVRTPGGLPNSVTIEAMKLGAAHVLRNPTVYTWFSRLGLVTGIGTGVYRAIALVREATGMELDIYLQEGELVMSLPRSSVMSP